MLAGIAAVHDDVPIIHDLETPGLGVVAARRPAREIENLFGHGPRARCGRRGSAFEMPARQGQAQALQRIIVPPGTPAYDQPVAVGIKLQAPGCGHDATPAQQDLQCLGPSDTGAQFTGHGGGGSSVVSKVDGAGLDEVSRMQAQG